MRLIPPLTHLGDLTVEQFLKQYWHKQHLLIRNAFPDFEAVISADELAGLACEHEVESRLLIEDPASGDWQLKPGPFSESTFGELPDSHWTLLVQAVDHWVPQAADFVERFRFIPSWRLDDLMISYATEGGGVGPHYDNYDVFLIQAEGQRRWEIGGHYDEQAEFLPDKPVRILRDWQPEQSWVLNPGDMLYLPPRVGHNGVALGDGCVTYSVGYRAPQVGDMLLQFAAFCNARLPEEQRYADVDLGLRASSGRIESEDLQRVQAIFRRVYEDPTLLRDWFGHLVSEPKYPEPAGAETNTEETPVVPDDAVQQLRAELLGATLVRRSEGVRYAYYQDQNSLTLYVDGNIFPCDQALGPLVALLCDSNSYTSGELLDWMDGEAGQSLLCRLFEHGFMYAA